MIIVIPKVENLIHGKVNVFKDIIQEMKKTQFALKKYTVFQKMISDSECVKPRNFLVTKIFHGSRQKKQVTYKVVRKSAWLQTSPQQHPMSEDNEATLQRSKGKKVCSRILYPAKTAF